MWTSDRVLTSNEALELPPPTLSSVFFPAPLFHLSFILAPIRSSFPLPFYTLHCFHFGFPQLLFFFSPSPMCQPLLFHLSFNSNLQLLPVSCTYLTCTSLLFVPSLLTCYSSLCPISPLLIGK